MTSGMSAKGSALGTSVPESAAPPNRAPAPRASGNTGNGDGRGHEAQTATDPKDSAAGGTGETEGTFAGSIGAESVTPALSSSVRTLILGIDYDGRIVQYDRNVPRILAREPDELLGAQLSDLTVRSAQPNSHAARPLDGVAAVSGLLEAIRSDREGSAMLTIQTRDGLPAEAVVTVHPMRAGGTSLAALALLRIPAPNSERFVDPALMRRQMLDDALTRIGDTLDIDDVARVLLDALVPHFCNVSGLLLLESLAGGDELPSHGPEGSLPLRR